MSFPKQLPSLFLGLALVGAAVAACTGSNTNGTATSGAVTPDASGPPTVRLYVLSNVAGALEPCGCSKDQLGGADHFAAFLSSERARVANSIVVGAGPLFFQDPTLTGDGVTQAKWKADALASAAKTLGIVAWAPGANDFAAGADGFQRLAEASGISFVSANLKGASPLVASKMVESGGIKIATVGVSTPQGSVAKLEIAPAKEALAAEVASARAAGARIVVALVALPRGEALRMVEELTDIDVLVVGKPTEKGDVNDKPKPATMIGSTLVVETSNHLQTFGVIDVFVREPAGATGRIKLSDGGGVARAEQLITLAQQVRDLEHRINGWETDKNVNAADLAARKADLERVRSEKAALEATNDPPPEGSYFKYSLVEVRDKLGEDKPVGDVVLGYYKKVNEHNREAFKDRKPPSVEEGKAGYLGIAQCSTCHAEEKAVFDKTDHAHAYPTLEKKFVEFNLDCVSCHVTGYGKPGGSTVTHVEELKNVQCETCHGPGSLHAKEPKKAGLITRKPDPKSCVSECHHPPHVEGFDPVAKMERILGPGHGR